MLVKSTGYPIRTRKQITLSCKKAGQSIHLQYLIRKGVIK